MRIAFVGQKGIPATYGGVERYVEELSTRLAKRGHFVWVYARKYYTQSNDRMYKGVHRVHVPTLQSKYFDTVIHTVLSIFHLVFKQVDIVYVHSVGPSLFIPLIRILKPGTKVVSVFQCRDEFQQKWGPIASRILRLGGWMTCKAPHATVTSSKILHAYARDSYHTETTQIYNGAPVARELKSNEVGERFGLNHGDYLLMVTRFVPHKNVHLAIKAFKKTTTTKKLVIAGGSTHTDDYTAKLHELAKGDDRIIFTDFVSGTLLWELFQKAYAFVQPSSSEGLPLSVLEAMSYGIGVLASDIPEHRELLGVHGLYFDLQEPHGLANRMTDLLAKPEEVFASGSALKQRSASVFGWEKVTDDVEALFERVLDDKRVVSPVLEGSERS